MTSFALTQFANEFDRIIRCRFIEEELKTFITVEKDLWSIYQNEILPNTFLASLFPGTTGYVTQNKRIFIKDYSRYNKNTSESTRGAIYFFFFMKSLIFLGDSHARCELILVELILLLTKAIRQLRKERLV